MKRRTSTSVKMSTRPVNTSAHHLINQIVKADISGLRVYLIDFFVVLLLGQVGSDWIWKLATFKNECEL